MSDQNPDGMQDFIPENLSPQRLRPARQSNSLGLIRPGFVRALLILAPIVILLIWATGILEFQHPWKAWRAGEKALLRELPLGSSVSIPRYGPDGHIDPRSIWDDAASTAHTTLRSEAKIKPNRSTS